MTEKFKDVPTDNFGNYNIEIYVDSNYDQKDDLKQHGAKWNSDLKLWFFRYNLQSYEDKGIFKNTYDYSPCNINIVKYDTKLKQFNDVHLSSKEKGYFLKEAIARWKIYLKQMERAQL